MREKIINKINILSSEAWAISEKIEVLRGEISSFETRLSQITGAIQALDEVLKEEGAEDALPVD